MAARQCKGANRATKGLLYRHGSPLLPRKCGEQIRLRPLTDGIDGLSPQVQGTVLSGVVRGLVVRFIPADVGNRPATGRLSAGCSVHPRRCREQTSAGLTNNPNLGLSPPVRGTDLRDELLVENPRFIPACAGNSNTTCRNLSWATVYPRLCGEQITRAPRRGTRFGFIPACAGNRAIYRRQRGEFPVYPRLCGEQEQQMTPHQALSGLSPPVRGTAGCLWAGMKSLRFIPACAGNSGWHRRPTDPRPVYPRLCGEQAISLVARFGTNGLSPPVRGTGRRGIRHQCTPRFIPACAGNSRPKTLPARPPEVYPRLCGEQPLMDTLPAGTRGLSPPVRGTGQGRGVEASARRFIPACAGNRGKARSGKQRLPVYPRLCGEQISLGAIPESQPGLSPPVRGTDHIEELRKESSRFIPACAGNSPGAGIFVVITPVYPRLCGEQ